MLRGLLVFSSCPLYSYEFRNQKPSTAAGTPRLSVVFPPSKIASPLGESIFDRGAFLSEKPAADAGIVFNNPRRRRPNVKTK
jgi:hypothetical protein